MPTGDERVNIALKRFLSQNRMTANFLEYLDDILTDGLSRIFPESGLFTYPVSFTFPAPGEITITTDPVEGIDNAGHVLTMTGSDYLDNISFEDDGSSHYWVGMKYIRVASGVRGNSRTGVAEYDKWRDEVGEIDSPGLNVSFPAEVADIGSGQIRLVVNTIFEANVDHSGRKVLAYLENPMTSDEAVAFEELTVQYSGGDNYVETSTSFGQGSISLVATDYVVAAIGVTIRQSTPNPFGDEYIILADVDSTGPTADNGEQRDLSGGGGHTLQKAYDGLAGSGSGRNITANDLAMRIVQQNSVIREKDIAQAALRIEKSTDKSALSLVSLDPKDFETGIDTKGRMRGTGLVLTRVNLYDMSGSGFLDAEESDVQVTAVGDTFTFNRVGVDLTMTGLNGALLPGVDMLEISGSIYGNDGVYIVNVVSTASVTLLELDFTTPTLAQEIGNANLRASFYRPTAQLGAKFTETHQLIGVEDWMSDGAASQIPVRLLIPPNCEANLPSLAAQQWEVQGGGFLKVTNNLAIHRDGSNKVRLAPGMISSDVETTVLMEASSGDIVNSGIGDIRHSSSGDIEHTGSGDIKHVGTGDFKVGANADYKFDPARTVYHPIDISECIPRYSTSEDFVLKDIGSGVLAAESVNAASVLIVPIPIPLGATLTDVEAIVKDGSSNLISMSLLDAAFDWSGGTVGSVGSNGSDTSDGSGTEQKLAISSLSITRTAGSTYRVSFQANASGLHIYAVRCIYSMESLKGD